MKKMKITATAAAAATTAKTTKKLKKKVGFNTLNLFF